MTEVLQVFFTVAGAHVWKFMVLPATQCNLMDSVYTQNVQYVQRQLGMHIMCNGKNLALLTWTAKSPTHGTSWCDYSICEAFIAALAIKLRSAVRSRNHLRPW